MKQIRKIIRSKILIGFIVFFVFSIIFNVGLFLYIKKKEAKFISPISSNRPISSLQLDFKSVENILSKNKIPFTSITSSQSAILINLKTGEEVTLSSKKNIDSQISSLQLVLSRLTIEGKRFKSLDFRFDKPIIIFRE